MGAQNVINQTAQSGKLFVASAGNGGVNVDAYPHYPSGFTDEMVLAVAASTHMDTLW